MQIQRKSRALGSPPSYTQQLADFAVNLKLSDVPADTIARAKSVMLDGLGCGLFGVHLPWTRILAKLVNSTEPQGGRASIWGTDQTASPFSAALINGTMIQGYELDDANPASIHSCAAVLPAVMAAVEHVGAQSISGEKLLTAVIAGFEVGPRVGLCMNGNKMLAKGWHTPGIFGPFPAAAAAGHVLGIDSAQMNHAFGIAAPQAAGILATQFGSMVKRMLSAKAAQSGLYSALLARDGFTGAEDVFEEEYGGFCTTFTQSTDQFDLSALAADLGTRWETMRISIKRHASVGTNLSALDALDELMAEGLKADDVERIVFRMTDDAVRHSWWLPYEPTGLTAAQMHLGFCAAMKLIDGEVFVDQMVDANIARPDLLAFAQRVDVQRDEEREKKGRPFARGVDVEVTLKNGKTLRRVVDNFLGSFQRPMTDEQMAVKYRRLAAKALPPQAVQDIEHFVRNMERETSAAPLVRLLRGVSTADAVMTPARTVAAV
ncbi:MmgE/PrpD family protein [Hydrogenophaga sp.]|uniref:MmgE/PrpD family protein n=1 Tax=Hydrogenophaga sp. TaxID=1904254 RepID=UPI0027237BE5|nr:MmgE/PrpD family protein [Hydrogenophaga sp.]MDO9437247.1 MmgE/PrpD family protein [Hydrogenophaga sp.]